MTTPSAGRSAAPLPYPRRVTLALRPTPLQPLPRLSARVGRRILCKRDDLTGALLSGNKVRKLEFSLAEALGRGCVGVVTCGGVQSNHARATAAAAARLGLRCQLLLRVDDPETPPAPEGNTLLDRLLGAEVRWISAAQYAERQSLLPEVAAELQARGEGSWFVVPEGASDALGSWGYVACAEELAAQLAPLGPDPATVVFAVGSGGTAAGLHAGCQLLGLPHRLVGVCVTDDRPTFQRRIAGILDDLADQYDLPLRAEPERIEIWQEYVGRGYALSRPEELRRIRELARLEGVITDPVYSGKALHGLLSELERGTTLPEPIVFLHTGGIYGLFPKAGEIAPLL